MADSPLVLIVDDSPIQRKIYAATLKADGYAVLVAENGREGVAVALESRPALILMDVSMPEMDGPTAVRELRRHPDMDRVPVLAVTAVTERDEVDQLFQAGFDDVIDKNCDRAVLLDRVRHWMAA
jgi:CheY-like chemotaxis protein